MLPKSFVWLNRISIRTGPFTWSYQSDIRASLASLDGKDLVAHSITRPVPLTHVPITRREAYAMRVRAQLPRAYNILALPKSRGKKKRREERSWPENWRIWLGDAQELPPSRCKIDRTTSKFSMQWEMLSLMSSWLRCCAVFSKSKCLELYFFLFCWNYFQPILHRLYQAACSSTFLAYHFGNTLCFISRRYTIINNGVWISDD